VVAPELAKLEQRRERLRYERQEEMIVSLRDAGRLQPGLGYATARDIFWMLTGRDAYRVLVPRARVVTSEIPELAGRPSRAFPADSRADQTEY